MIARPRAWSRLARFLAACVVGFMGACAAPPAGPPVAATRPAQDAPGWPSIDDGRFRLRIQPVGQLHNSGTQLPVVSPDGKWIAELSCPDTAALDPSAAVTGKTLRQVTLRLHALDDSHSPPRVVAAGAAWPAWSSDSRSLVAVAYDDKGRCGLIIHDVVADATRRVELDLPHVLTPAISPDGKRIALVGFAADPADARLYIYDLPQQKLLPLAPPPGVAWQVNPRWVAPTALICFGRKGDETGVIGAVTDAQGQPAWLDTVAFPPDPIDLIYSQSGITNPLSDDGQSLAVYDAGSDRLVLHNLRDRTVRSLSPGSRTGCWVRSSRDLRFLQATDHRLSVVRAADGDEHVISSGALLPLWCDPQGRRVLALSADRQPWTFNLFWLHILPPP